MSAVKGSPFPGGLAFLCALFLLTTSLLGTETAVADVISGSFEGDYSHLSSTEHDATGETTRTKSDGFIQRYNLMLNKSFYPQLRLTAGYLFESDQSWLTTNDTDSHASVTTNLPSVDLTMGNPLLNAGVGPDDPRMQKALEHLRARPPEKTYEVSLQTMVFARAEPDAFRFLEMQDHTPYLDRDSRAVELSVLAPLVVTGRRLRTGGGPPVDLAMALVWGAFVGIVKAEVIPLGYILEPARRAPVNPQAFRGFPRLEPIGRVSHPTQKPAWPAVGEPVDPITVSLSPIPAGSPVAVTCSATDDLGVVSFRFTVGGGTLASGSTSEVVTLPAPETAAGFLLDAHSVECVASAGVPSVRRV